MCRLQKIGPGRDAEEMETEKNTERKNALVGVLEMPFAFLPRLGVTLEGNWADAQKTYCGEKSEVPGLPGWSVA